MRWFRALLLVALLAPLPLTAQSDLLAARTKGSASAPVTVYEMSDFQCPYCKQHNDTVQPILDREYVATGKVRWIFINYPLTSVHPNAAAAAEFAMCSAKQGKFWPAHDILFRTQGVWAPVKDPGAFLMSLSDSLSLSRQALLRCLETAETRTLVQGDAEGARRAGARSTPTFYIEGGLMVGVYDVAVFRQVLDSVYAVKAKR